MSFLHTMRSKSYARSCSNRRRVPDSYIRRYGGHQLSNQDSMDTIQFDKTGHEEDYMGAGTDRGDFLYGRVKQFVAVTLDDENISPLHSIHPNDNTHAIGDFTFLPDNRVALMSLGGTLYHVDLMAGRVYQGIKTQPSAMYCASRTERGVGVVCTRDGTLTCYDARCNVLSALEGVHRDVPGRKMIFKKGTPTPNVTSICNIDERFYATATSMAEKGVRVWDLRYKKISTPYHTFRVPIYKRKHIGVYAMSIDRKVERLVIACTDGYMREYSTRCKLDTPTRVYAHGTSGGNYNHNIAHSPITDHFIAPTRDGIGIYDYQSQSKQRASTDETSTTLDMTASLSATASFNASTTMIDASNELFTRATRPKFHFKSANEETLSHCDWSSNGRYLAMTTANHVIICDRESEWAQQCANAEHEDKVKETLYGAQLNFTYPVHYTI